MSAKASRASYKIESPKRRALVVVGMHRSGTSAMTGTLSLLGAQLPKQLMAPNVDNPSGFWEAQSVADLNDEILNALGSEWDDVFAFRAAASASDFGHHYLGRAVELLREEFDGSELIVLKDPRFSVFTWFWDRALREAGYATNYVVMVRDPLEIAESLHGRNGFSREKSLLLWTSYMIAAERNTRDWARLFVSYDQLIRDWRVVRESVEASTGTPLPRDSASAAIEVDAFLDPQLRHHKALEEDIFSSAGVAQEIKTVARILFDAAAGAEIDYRALDAVGDWLGELDALVGPLLRDSRLDAQKYAHEAATFREEHAGARQRAEAFAEQLALEQASREARAQDYERQAAEGAERISAAYAERDRLAVELEERGRQGEALAARIASVERERDVLASEVREKCDEIQYLVEQVETCRTNLSTARANVANLEQRIGGFDAELQRAIEVAERLADCRVAEAQSERDQMAAELAAERLKARSLEQNARAELDRVLAELEHANATLHRFRTSVSWRVTRPLRWTGRALGTLR